ncbi:MAG: twin-arginine translocation signal domain-containing protein, partial [Nitrososphaeraceae archaeon]
MSDKQDSLKDNQISRRGFLKLAGAGTFFLGLGAFGISNILNNIREASAQAANATNATNATGASAAPPSNNLAIRPFRVNVPEAELTELRRRVSATR